VWAQLGSWAVSDAARDVLLLALLLFMPLALALALVLLVLGLVLLDAASAARAGGATTRGKIFFDARDPLCTCSDERRLSSSCLF
jgi:hypothetical protein